VLVRFFFLKSSNFISYGRKINSNHKKHKNAHPNKQKLINHTKSRLVTPAMCLWQPHYSRDRETLNHQEDATLEPPGASSGVKDADGVLKGHRKHSAPRVRVRRVDLC